MKSRFRFNRLNNRKPRNYIRLWKVLPSIITIFALCLGITSIIFAINKDWQTSVLLILFAGLLDGVDGRLARFLSTSSPFGAELDSLCDFVNFGIAPGLLNYFWLLDLQGIYLSKIMWCTCLIYCACMAIRLARFNTMQDTKFSKNFFLGVPAPCCAMLVLAPISLNIELEIFKSNLRLYPLYILFVSFLCISRIPTFSIKNVVIKQKYLKLFFFTIMCLVGVLFINIWLFFPLLSLIYLLVIPISWYKSRSLIMETATEVSINNSNASE